MTVAEYLSSWLYAKRCDLEQSTYEAYLIYLNKHIIPYFNELGKPLEELIPLDVLGYVTAKRNGGRCDGKSGGLSAVSVRKHLNIIKQAFRDAVLYGMIRSSPAEPVKLPRQRGTTSEAAQFVTLDRVRAILDAFRGHRFYPLIVVTVYYGLRRSEVLGLKWSAVDFHSAEIRICRTVVKNLTIVEKERTKTQSSRRVFPLLPEVAEVLKRIRPHKVDEDSYIFSREDGQPLRPDSVTRGFQRVLKAHKLPLMRFHDLRHATASILFDSGWSIADVQHWLGHSDIETTMNIYVAYNSTRKLRLGGALSRLLT